LQNAIREHGVPMVDLKLDRYYSREVLIVIVTGVIHLPRIRWIPDLFGWRIRACCTCFRFGGKAE